ncbi:MAG TPA: hypothetical protein VK821_13380 [Dehalococcoidia bacterium]|nr:hypothetical protein [Dehalococcoidia bacterium]
MQQYIQRRVRLHVIVMSQSTGDESVLLLERETGIVEFPAFDVDLLAIEDEGAVVGRIASEIGLQVAPVGFIEGSSPSEESRFLVVRSLGGSPRFAVPHAGWEWRPAARLLTRESIPKLMADELRSFMNC